MTILDPHAWPTCDQHLNGGGMVCTLRPGHNFGCIYVSREASDRHTEANHD